MASLDIINASKKKVGSVDLPDVAEKKINKSLVYQAVKRQLAASHHGTVKTKGRAEVHRTGKKLYKQKGTGNARHGSRRAPIFVGGGTVFGPLPRSFALDMPKKMRRQAFAEILRAQIADGKVTVIDSIPLKNIKTKEAHQFLKNLGISQGLVVLEGASDVLQKSFRNIPNFKPVLADQLNLIDVLKFQNVLFTAPAFEKVKEHYLV